jgi:hypothetical protein
MLEVTNELGKKKRRVTRAPARSAQTILQDLAGSPGRYAAQREAVYHVPRRAETLANGHDGELDSEHGAIAGALCLLSILDEHLHIHKRPIQPLDYVIPSPGPWT